MLHGSVRLVGPVHGHPALVKHVLVFVLILHAPHVPAGQVFVTLQADQVPQQCDGVGVAIVVVATHETAGSAGGPEHTILPLTTCAT